MSRENVQTVNVLEAADDVKSSYIRRLIKLDNECFDTPDRFSERDWVGYCQNAFFNIIFLPDGKPDDPILANLVATVHDKHGVKEIYVDNIAVTKSCRGKGFAVKLFRMLVEAIESNSEVYENIFLDVNQDAAAAQTLYEKLGFIPIPERSSPNQINMGAKLSEIKSKLYFILKPKVIAIAPKPIKFRIQAVYNQINSSDFAKNEVETIQKLYNEANTQYHYFDQHDENSKKEFLRYFRFFQKVAETEDSHVSQNELKNRAYIATVLFGGCEQGKECEILQLLIKEAYSNNEQPIHDIFAPLTIPIKAHHLDLTMWRELINSKYTKKAIRLFSSASDIANKFGPIPLGYELIPTKTFPKKMQPNKLYLFEQKDQKKLPDSMDSQVSKKYGFAFLENGEIRGIIDEKNLTDAINNKLRSHFSDTDWKSGEKINKKLTIQEQDTIFNEIQKISHNNVLTRKKTIDEIVILQGKLTYQNFDKDLALASLCRQYRMPEMLFEKCLALLPEQKQKDHLPNIIIYGNNVDPSCENYVLLKLPFNDPRAFLLGQITNCCQSIGGHSEACVIDGWTRADNGFYVLLKKEKSDQFLLPLLQNGEINYNNYSIVGQGYAWRSQFGNLVFDSWENLRPTDNEIAVKMLIEFSKAVVNERSANIARVTIGTGGNTPKGFFEKNPIPAEKILQGFQYQDSFIQENIFDCEEKWKTELETIMSKIDVFTVKEKEKLVSHAPLSFHYFFILEQVCQNKVLYDFIKIALTRDESLSDILRGIVVTYCVSSPEIFNETLLIFLNNISSIDYLVENNPVPINDRPQFEEETNPNPNEENEENPWDDEPEEITFKVPENFQSLAPEVSRFLFTLTNEDGHTDFVKKVKLTSHLIAFHKILIQKSKQQFVEKNDEYYTVFKLFIRAFTTTAENKEKLILKINQEIAKFNSYQNFKILELFAKADYLEFVDYLITFFGIKNIPITTLLTIFSFAILNEKKALTVLILGYFIKNQIPLHMEITIFDAEKKHPLVEATKKNNLQLVTDFMALAENNSAFRIDEDRSSFRIPVALYQAFVNAIQIQNRQLIDLFFNYFEKNNLPYYVDTSELYYLEEMQNPLLEIVKLNDATSVNRFLNLHILNDEKKELLKWKILFPAFLLAIKNSNQELIDIFFDFCENYEIIITEDDLEYNRFSNKHISNHPLIAAAKMENTKLVLRYIDSQTISLDVKALVLAKVFSIAIPSKDQAFQTLLWNRLKTFEFQNEQLDLILSEISEAIVIENDKELLVNFISKMDTLLSKEKFIDKILNLVEKTSELKTWNLMKYLLENYIDLFDLEKVINDVFFHAVNGLEWTIVNEILENVNYGTLLKPSFLINALQQAVNSFNYAAIEKILYLPNPDLKLIIFVKEVLLPYFNNSSSEIYNSLRVIFQKFISENREEQTITVKELTDLIEKIRPSYLSDSLSTSGFFHAEPSNFELAALKNLLVDKKPDEPITFSKIESVIGSKKAHLLKNPDTLDDVEKTDINETVREIGRYFKLSESLSTDYNINGSSIKRMIISDILYLQKTLFQNQPIEKNKLFDIFQLSILIKSKLSSKSLEKEILLLTPDEQLKAFDLAVKINDHQIIKILLPVLKKCPASTYHAFAMAIKDANSEMIKFFNKYFSEEKFFFLFKNNTDNDSKDFLHPLIVAVEMKSFEMVSQLVNLYRHGLSKSYYYFEFYDIKDEPIFCDAFYIAYQLSNFKIIEVLLNCFKDLYLQDDDCDVLTCLFEKILQKVEFDKEIIKTILENLPDNRMISKIYIWAIENNLENISEQLKIIYPSEISQILTSGPKL